MIIRMRSSISGKPSPSDVIIFSSSFFLLYLFPFRFIIFFLLGSPHHRVVFLNILGNSVCCFWEVFEFFRDLSSLNFFCCGHYKGFGMMCFHSLCFNIFFISSLFPHWHISFLVTSSLSRYLFVPYFCFCIWCLVSYHCSCKTILDIIFILLSLLRLVLWTRITSWRIFHVQLKRKCILPFWR